MVRIRKARRSRLGATFHLELINSRSQIENAGNKYMLNLPRLALAGKDGPRLRLSFGYLHSSGPCFYVSLVCLYLAEDLQ